MQVHRIFKSRSSSTAVQASLALACALLWQTSSAQTAMAPATESAANPVASVPAVVYRSVFKETSLGVEKDTDNWRKANDEVGKFLRGHLDILKWEEQESAKAMKGGMEQPADKAMAKPMAEPDALNKPVMQQPADTMSPKSNATKPIASPAHKH
jgi:hypothetical protein